MTISEIHSLKPDSVFKYQGQKASVTYIRPPYPDDIISINGKMVKFPDISVHVAFTLEDGSKIAISSMLNSVMIKEGRVVPLELEDYKRA